MKLFHIIAALPFLGCKNIHKTWSTTLFSTNDNGDQWQTVKISNIVYLFWQALTKHHHLDNCQLSCIPIWCLIFRLLQILQCYCQNFIPGNLRLGIFEQIWSANEKQFHENDKIISVGLNAGFDFATFLRDQRCCTSNQNPRPDCSKNG